VSADDDAEDCFRRLAGVAMWKPSSVTVLDTARSPRSAKRRPRCELDWGTCGATWRILLNDSCSAAMQAVDTIAQQLFVSIIKVFLALLCPMHLLDSTDSVNVVNIFVLFSVTLLLLKDQF